MRAVLIIGENILDKSLLNTVLYPIADMNPQYYNWLFHTTEFADEFYRWGHGIVDDLWTTGWQDMKNIVIIQPSIEEQQRIAVFLDTHPISKPKSTHWNSISVASSPKL